MDACPFGPGTIMGEPNMFDLNEQITKWRNSLAQPQTLGKTDIDELESHLRAEIDSLKTFKLSDEETFWIAVHRLGNTDSLSNEFAKINRGIVFKQKASWMISGILIYLVATYFARFVSEESIRFAINRGMSGYGSLGLVGFVAQILAWAMILFLSYFVFRLILRIPGFKRKMNQLLGRISLLTILFVFLAIVFCYGVTLHIPVPAFRNLSVERYTKEALKYTQLLWSVLLPSILVMALVILRKSSKRKMESI